MATIRKKNTAGSTGTFTLPKPARLLKRRQFLALTDRKTRPELTCKTGSFLVLGRSNSLRFCRLGVTVTKKVGGAVQRNRLRRRVREFFRLNRSRWPAGLDLLFIVRIGASEKPIARLRADLAQIDRKLMAFTFSATSTDGTNLSSLPTPITLVPPGQEKTNAGGNKLLVALTLQIIGFYQRFISSFLPPACRFWPTCSQYAATAIAGYGFWQGTLLTTRRLLKCHPLHPGGYDPVPPPIRRF